MQQFKKGVCLRSLGLAVTLTSLFVGSGSASIIPAGQVNFGGNVTVTPAMINFFGGPMGTTPNVVNVGQPDTGGFSGFSAGTIQNLNGSFPVPQFLTLATTMGPVFFDLQGFNPGTGTNAACSSGAVGAVCTPTGSSFTLTQNQGLVSISLSLFGMSYSGSAGTGSDPTQGLITSQAPGTIAQVLAAASSQAGFSDSYSATLIATAPTNTPEPGSFLALGSGLLLLSTGLYRRRQVRS
ncbi:MAG: hypothetical protein M3Z09_06170 [Acidobacteriota bacterium]|nr:hypothetical protein [Acidobacteriota bacterium]